MTKAIWKDDIETALSIVKDEFKVSDLIDLIKPKKDEVLNLRWSCNAYLKSKKSNCIKFGKDGLEVVWKKVKDKAKIEEITQKAHERQQQKLSSSSFSAVQIGESVIALIDKLKMKIATLNEEVHQLVDEKKDLEQTIRTLKSRAYESTKSLSISELGLKGE